MSYIKRNKKTSVVDFILHYGELNRQIGRQWGLDKITADQFLRYSGLLSKALLKRTMTQEGLK
jgi:hypothetical protein